MIDKMIRCKDFAASKEIAGIGFTLSYIDAQKDGSNGTYLNKDREYVTLSAKKVF